MNKFGDFQEVKDGAKGKETQQPVQQDVSGRVRYPGKGQLIGVVRQRLGGNRMEVRSNDGKTRNCRVPGRFKRTMWLRPKDVVMVKPWVDDDLKADVIYKYNSSAINQLRKKGMLDSIKDGF